MLCDIRYTIPAAREGRSGNVPDDIGKLLRDDVMGHVPGIGHLAQRALRQFCVQAPGLAVAVHNLIAQAGHDRDRDR